MANYSSFIGDEPEDVPPTSKKDWVGDNLLNPLYNAAIVQSANAAINLVDLTVKEGLIPKLTPRHTSAPETPAEVFGQGLASGIGSILPYAVASKVAGGLLHGAGRAAALEGTIARVVASEHTAQILGAAAFDALRDRHHGETQVGNVLGGAAAFGTFALGNQFIRGRMSLADSIIARGAIGGVGGITQLSVSSALSGQEVSGADVARAAVHGGIFNVGLHGAHVGTNKLIDSVNAKLGRGVPVEHFAQSQGLLDTSPTLNSLLRDNPLARVNTKRTGPSQADHGRQTVTVNVEGNVAAELGHELGHLTVRKSQEGFDRASELLNAGRVQEAKQAYLETRRLEESQATSLGENVRRESPLSSIGENSAAGSKMHGGKDPFYEALFEAEWTQFQQSDGRYRPRIDFHDTVSSSYQRIFEETGLNIETVPAWMNQFKPTGEVHQGNNAVVIMLEPRPGFPDSVLKLLPQWDGQKSWEPALFNKNGRRIDKPVDVLYDSNEDPQHVLIEELVNFDSQEPGLNRLLGKLKSEGLDPSDPGSGPAYGWGTYSKRWVCADRDSLAPTGSGLHSVEQASAFTAEELNQLRESADAAPESGPSTQGFEPLINSLNEADRGRVAEMFPESPNAVEELLDLLTDPDSTRKMAIQTAQWITANGDVSLAKEQLAFVAALAQQHGRHLAPWSATAKVHDVKLKTSTDIRIRVRSSAAGASLSM